MDLIELAEQIVKGQMLLIGFEDEQVCSVNSNTDFKIIKHYCGKTFYGYNVYAREGLNLILLETYNKLKKAESVIADIKAGLALGVPFYKLPSN